MLKSLLICLGLLTVLMGNAQTYRKIPPTGARWKMEWGSLDLGTCLWDGGFYMYTAGDTLIAGLNMTKISSPGYSACIDQPCATWLPPIQYPQFIYQDSLGGVFMLNPSGLLSPIMDYSLQPGDTLIDSVNAMWGRFEYVVDSVDTVTFMDGIHRKRLFVNRYCCMGPVPCLWIEGMGDQYKGLFPDPEFESWSFCLCYKEDSLILHNGSPFNYWQCGNDCDILSATALPINTTIRAVPNPSDGHWSIETSGNIEVVHIGLLDISGKLIWDKTCSNNEPPLIDPSISLPIGIYFAQIEMADGSILMLKLLKD